MRSAATLFVKWVVTPVEACWVSVTVTSPFTLVDLPADLFEECVNLKSLKKAIVIHGVPVLLKFPR